MTEHPVEIAERIRMQRRALRRVARLSVPVSLIGFAIIYATASRVSGALANLVMVPTVLAFLVSWLCFWGLWVLGLRDFRNMLRPGSADAYDRK